MLPLNRRPHRRRGVRIAPQPAHRRDGRGNRVGADVGIIAQHVVSEQSRILAVIVYELGMALFGVIMGNAFAAFPIMTAAVGWPVLVEHFGAAPGCFSRSAC